jgi:putative endonuclease
MEKQYYVYLMTNDHNSVIYTGVTSGLKKRIYEHKEKIIPGFTAKYNVAKLVYYEAFADPESAIRREKQLKGGSRRKKINLVNGVNREWRDLYQEL